MIERKLRSGIMAVLVLAMAGMISCKDDSSDPQKKSGDTNNYNQFLKYDLRGVTYETKTFTADYGSKIFITGYSSSGGILADFALRAKKDELIPGAPFSLDASGELSTAIMYIGSDQWMIGDGGFTISKHTNNRLTGTFSGKAYQIEYAGQDPVIVDSAFVTNGVFNDILVND